MESTHLVVSRATGHRAAGGLRAGQFGHGGGCCRTSAADRHRNLASSGANYGCDGRPFGDPATHHNAARHPNTGPATNSYADHGTDRHARSDDCLQSAYAH